MSVLHENHGFVTDKMKSVNIVPEQHGSHLLTKEENEQLFRLLGPRCQVGIFFSEFLNDFFCVRTSCQPNKYSTLWMGRGYHANLVILNVENKLWYNIL